MTIDDYIHRFSLLVVNQQGGRISPHKICMLLAVLDAARAGELTENRIEFSPKILERYQYFFEAVATDLDQPNPHLPFFHLRGKLADDSPSFWHLVAVPGRENELAAMTTATSPKKITDNIAYATLDPALFALLDDAANIDALMTALDRHWFHHENPRLALRLRRSVAISRYERRLREGPRLAMVQEPVPRYIRDPAFRRVVTEAYDYRCAASGARVVLPNGAALVEAAHIIPFSETQDDEPSNGLALSRDMHWAMDRLLIAPGPDLKWHVSKIVDSIGPELDALNGLRGRPLRLPEDKRFHPKIEALEWRKAQLM